MATPGWGVAPDMPVLPVPVQAGEVAFAGLEQSTAVELVPIPGNWAKAVNGPAKRTHPRKKLFIFRIVDRY